MSNNILIIGTYFDKAVDSYRWWSDLPNLSDYKTIILDPTRILHDYLYSGRVKPLSQTRYLLSDRNEQDDKIQSNIRLVRRKLIEMLQFDVNIYVLYSPTVTIEYIVEIYSKQPTSSVTRESVKLIKTNDWCPISIETYSEIGKIIHIKDDSYKEYLKDFRQWEYYFISESLNTYDLEKHYEKKWKVIIEQDDITFNNVKKPLAVEFNTFFHDWVHDEDEELMGWNQYPDFGGGNLILLPTIEPYNPKPHIDFLLKKTGLIEETPPPSWVNSIEIPGEAPLKQDIATQKQQLDIMASEVREKENSLAELQKYKGLLYETGESLQELVKTVLEHLGAGIEPSPVSDEFIINISGRKALVEVKGNTKSITKDDLGQLITDLGEYLKVADEDIDGTLIGNAWRLEPLEVRDTHDKPIFSQAVIQIAMNRNIGLLSTTELFRAYCKVLEDQTCKADILNGIIGGNGIIKF